MMTSQSFLVETEQQRFLAFGNVCIFRPGIDDVTTISCGGRAGKMCRVCQCLLSADKKLVTSQSFHVNAEQKVCLLFGIVYFLSTRNS